MTRNIALAAEGILQIAMNGFNEYCDRHGLVPASLPIEVVEEALKRHVSQRLDEAFDDAIAAENANMREVAAATFATSISLAGIEAAKEVFHVTD